MSGVPIEAAAESCRVRLVTAVATVLTARMPELGRARSFHVLLLQVLAIFEK